MAAIPRRSHSNYQAVYVLVMAKGSIPMRSLVTVVVLVACSSNLVWAQPRRELPVIADAVSDLSGQMFLNEKRKSIAFLDEGDSAWNVTHGDIRCNGPVYAFAYDYYGTENIFAGGDFDSIDGVRAERIAFINYGSVTEIGGGISDGVVYALAADDDNLFVGGKFTMAGDSVAVNNIAHWDGTSWYALGSGTDSTVLALMISDGLLYVGGNFRHAGDSEANYIAIWDIGLKRWRPITVSGVNGMNGGVAAFAAIQDVIFAGGGFTSAGSVTANKVAAFVAEQWAALSTGLSGANSYSTALSSDGYSLAAGGNFSQAGGTNAANIALYDLNSKLWIGVGAGFDGPVLGISREYSAGSLNTMIACGDFLHSGSKQVNNIAYFNDESWEPWGSGLNGPGYALANFEIMIPAFQMGDGYPVYVGGEFTTAGAKPSQNLAIHYYPPFKSVDANSSDFMLTVEPNPVSTGPLTIAISLPSQKPVRLSIADALGREVSVLADGEVITTREFRFDSRGLANGLYYCVLQTGGHTKTRKIIVSH